MGTNPQHIIRIQDGLPNRQGNPHVTPAQAGRLRELIREQTHNGLDIVTVVVRVMHGKYPDLRPSDRMKAAEFLADRLWGKPAQSIDVTSDGEKIVWAPWSFNEARE